MHADYSSLVAISAVILADTRQIGSGGVVAELSLLFSVVTRVGLLTGLFAVTGVLVVSLLD
jgi:hypothetical protein